MADPAQAPRRLLITLPNWVGDVVMASPILAAIRQMLPTSEITFLLRKHLAEIVAGCRWHDDELCWPGGTGVPREVAGWRLSREIRRRGFDTALLLTNSFRSAWLAWLAGVPRRIGYDRDARGWLLTERLQPLKLRGEYVPTPMLPYYADLAERIACTVSDFHLRLGVTDEQEAAGRALQAHYGLAPKRYAVRVIIAYSLVIGSNTRSSPSAVRYTSAA